MEEMKSTAPPPLPLASYAARYDSPLYGPIWVRVESAGLTLQMGEGQVADLEYHGGNAFFTRWRDPLFAENFGTHAEFAIEGDRVTGLTMTPNRERITASRP
jgi:hypothetical protein